MDADKKAVWGWALYDWANSAFATTVMAGFFPVFFKSYWSHGVDVNVSTAQLGFGNSMASFLVALMAPLLGAIADKGLALKGFMLFFAYMGAAMTASLFWVGEGRWVVAICVYAMAIVGFSGANVFYDALLPHVAGEKRVDYISSLGYSMGYLGGGLLFLANVLMTLMPHRFGLADAATAVRVSFVSVALWWGLFTLFPVAWVPQAATSTRSGLWQWTMDGLRQLSGTFRKVRYLKTVLLFLVAYWLYIDGVDTIIRMAVDYGMSIGFATTDLITALLVVQFVGFPAALVFGKLGQDWGVRRSIYLAIGIYILITLWGTLMTSREEFYVLAVLIGMVQGGIQALSRSYYSRLIPRNQAGEFYGFYNMMGKFAAILGPSLMAVVGLAARRLLMPVSPSSEQLLHVSRLASRWSMASVLVLFALGAALLSFVDEEKGKREALHLADKLP